MDGQPQYQVRQQKMRALLPHALALVALSILFYLGVLLNLALLSIETERQDMVKLGAFVLLAVLVIMGLVVKIQKARKNYLFYPAYLIIGRKEVPYRLMRTTLVRQTIIDKMFHTYSLIIEHATGEKTVLHNLPLAIPLQPYLQQQINASQYTLPG